MSDENEEDPQSRMKLHNTIDLSLSIRYSGMSDGFQVEGSDYLGLSLQTKFIMMIGSGKRCSQSLSFDIQFREASILR
jgi:hypothetical protein